MSETSSSQSVPSGGAARSRRSWLRQATGSLVLGGSLTSPRVVASLEAPTPGGAPKAPKPFPLCLNTSTVRNAEGQPRPILELITIAQQAGYQALEPWISELQAYLKTGGTAAELGRRFRDAGLAIPDAIGFAEWIVPDAARRQKALDQAKRDMELVQEIGGQRIAAPPVGATAADAPALDPLEVADRYAQLFELGQTMGITPIVEIWGFSKNLNRLGQAMLVALESHQERAAILPDVYHLYKGGSDFSGLRLLAGAAIGIFHVNDYPARERSQITDADRVYPGLGLAPWGTILPALRHIQYQGYLSVELFNRAYWKQDPHQVARTAREQMLALMKA